MDEQRRDPSIYVYIKLNCIRLPNNDQCADNVSHRLYQQHLHAHMFNDIFSNLNHYPTPSPQCNMNKKRRDTSIYKYKNKCNDVTSSELRSMRLYLIVMVSIDFIIVVNGFRLIVNGVQSCSIDFQWFSMVSH